MKVLDIVVTIFLIIGALNWGLMGFFGYNVVEAILGEATALTRTIYAVVGLCGLYEAINFTVGYEAMHHRWCDMQGAIKH